MSDDLIEQPSPRIIAIGTHVNVVYFDESANWDALPGVVQEYANGAYRVTLDPQPLPQGVLEDDWYMASMVSPTDEERKET